jgi:hypothetical protein
MACRRSCCRISDQLSSSEFPRSSRVDSHSFSRIRPCTLDRWVRASSWYQQSNPVDGMSCKHHGIKLKARIHKEQSVLYKWNINVSAKRVSERLTLFVGHTKLYITSLCFDNLRLWWYIAGWWLPLRWSGILIRNSHDPTKMIQAI